MVKAFVPLELKSTETRVAATPDTVKRLVKAGLSVDVQFGAGSAAHFSDDSYRAAGAGIVAADDVPNAVKAADLHLCVQPPETATIATMKQGAIVVSFVLPAQKPEVVTALADAGVSSLAMDLVPRTTRAQSMDALSSQATLAGYKAALLGATHLGKLCPLMMTAAGTVPPAKAVIFGAGVAGLQAIATAKRLGCKVEATDIRMAAKEQVESLGARFIEVPGAADMEDEGGYAKEASADFLRRQREEVQKRVAEADIVITTAQVPGKKAPVLVDEDMVRSMPDGAVIIDLAVENGGNCALSKPGETIVIHGVTIVGIRNLPGTVAVHASELYAKNVLNLVQLLVREGGELEVDLEDDVIAGCLLTHGGEITHTRTREAMQGGAA